MTPLLLLLGMMIGGLVGALCGRTRGKEGLGLLAGALLGPIGWLIILLAYPYQAPAKPEPRRPRTGFINQPRS